MDENEVKRNYEAFRQRLPSILAAHQGKIALMHSGEIVAFFDTIGDANTAGQKLFKDQPFSLQEVTDQPIDLGFFSHATVSQRSV
jgi:hypothetical protein